MKRWCAVLLSLLLVAAEPVTDKGPGVTLKFHNGKTVRGTLAVKTLKVKSGTETKEVELFTVRSITFGKDRDTLDTTAGAVDGVVQAAEFEVNTELGLLTVKREQLVSIHFDESFTAASPAKVIKLACTIRQMILTKDGKSLYLLNGSDDRVQRLNVETQVLEETSAEVGGATGIFLSPDGKTLYAHGMEKGPNLGRTTIHIVEAASLKVTGKFGVAASPFSAIADDQGRLYLAGPRVVAVDVAKKEMIDTWNEGPQCSGSNWLRRSSDGKHLYLGVLGAGFPGSNRVFRLDWPERFPAADAARPLPVRVSAHGAEQPFDGWLPDSVIKIATRDGPRSVDLSKVGTNVIGISKNAEGVFLQAHQQNPAQSFVGKIEARDLKVRLEEGMLTLPFEKVYHMQRREVAYPSVVVPDAVFEPTSDEKHLVCISGPVLSLGPEMKEVTKVPAHHASAADPKAGVLFLALPGKKLDVYSYPQCKLQKSIVLPKQAYRMAYDPTTKRLFCAVAQDVPAGRLSVGVGDLHVYDVRALFDIK